MELILSPSVDIIKDGFGDRIAYQGGGLVVTYYNGGKPSQVPIFTKKIKFSNQSIQDFFSTETLPVKTRLRDPSFVRY